jgi:pimeloyl-ACP methyl ester carboxylesterase
MSTSSESHEVLTRLPAGKAKATPLLFIHGAYAAAWCWEDHFLPFFAEAGYAAHALSLSGPRRLAGAQAPRQLFDRRLRARRRDDGRRLPAPPVLIGHSMGGFVVQKYLEDHTSRRVPC